MSEDDGKGKWLWGAIGLAAGAGLAYWLLKKKGLLPAANQQALPQTVAAQAPDTGTEGMVAGLAADSGAAAPAPAPQATDIIDAEFEKLPEDEQQEF